MNNRQVGSEWEHIAVQYLEKQGFTILETNYRCPRGEIDIIARESGTLVFVEVKYRKDSKKGHPLESVNAVKQKKIIYASKHYLMTRHIPEDHSMRYDVIGIMGNANAEDEITHIKDAFWV